MFNVGDRVYVEGPNDRKKYGHIEHIVIGSTFPYRIDFDYPEQGYTLDVGFQKVDLFAAFSANQEDEDLPVVDKVKINEFYKTNVLVKLNGAELEHIYRTLNGEVSLFDVPVDPVELDIKLKQAAKDIKKVLRS